MNRFKHKLFTVLAVLFISMSIAPAAHADDLTLSGSNYQPGDLFASIIFSESADLNTADSVDISYRTIEGYPSTSDKTKTYGRMQKPNDGASSTTGKQLVSMLRTLYDYGWFEPAPKTEDGFIGMMQQLLGKVGNSISSAITSVALSGAVVFAGLFDAAASLIELIDKAARGFNVPSLFGFDTKSGTGFISDIIHKVFDSFGVNKTAIVNLQRFIMAGLAMMLVISAIIALGALGNHREKMKKVKNYSARIATVLVTLPVAMMMTTIIDTVSLQADTVKKLPEMFNQTYIVDTLDWAVYGNFDLAMINANGKLNDDGSKSKDFAPSAQNVANLASSINARKILLGGTAVESESSGTAMLSAFASHQMANVTQYYDGLAKVKDSTVESCTPTFVVAGGNNNDFSKMIGGNGNGNSKANAREPYDLNSFRTGYPANRKEDNDSYYTLNLKCGVSSNIVFLMPVDSKGDKTDATDQPSEVYISGQKFSLGDSDKVKVRPFGSGDPRSYLYGAVPATSKATKEYSNYIHDVNRSSQLIDPSTGQKVDHSASDAKAKAIWTNSLRIAIMNRYRGLKQLSFSDQSTAFFLQTKRTGDSSISYKGYYTIPDKANEAKNTGQFGNTFTRYVMPATSLLDMGTRIASLTAVWMIAAIMACVTIFIILRSPLLGALVKSVRGFLTALITGNVVGLLEYLTYYTAARMSLITAGIAIYFGTMLGKSIVVDSPIATALETFGSATLGPAVSTILVVLFALSACWPAFRIQGKNGKMRRSSVLGVIIMIPFMAADSISERLQDLHVKVYGEQRGSLLNGKVMRNSRKNKAEIARRNQAAKQERRISRGAVSKAVHAGGKIALHGAAAAATGGASVGASAAMLKAGAATKAGQLLAGTAGKAAVAGIGKSTSMQAIVKSPIGKVIAENVGGHMTGKRSATPGSQHGESMRQPIVRDDARQAPSPTQSGPFNQPAAPERKQIDGAPIVATTQRQSASVDRADIDRVVEAIDSQKPSKSETIREVQSTVSEAHQPSKSETIREVVSTPTAPQPPVESTHTVERSTETIREVSSAESSVPTPAPASTPVQPDIKPVVVKPVVPDITE